MLESALSPIATPVVQSQASIEIPVECFQTNLHSTLVTKASFQLTLHCLHLDKDYMKRLLSHSSQSIVVCIAKCLDFFFLVSLPRGIYLLFYLRNHPAYPILQKTFYVLDTFYRAEQRRQSLRPRVI